MCHVFIKNLINPEQAQIVPGFLWEVKAGGLVREEIGVARNRRDRAGNE